jgi:8-oxo-dGTP pyrophosphatase MutT (NUDIX family)
MNRIVRYQGAIIKDHHLLLIRHREHETERSYWLLPGGGVEDGETEEQCVVREMFEETGLVVQVERPLLDLVAEKPSPYQRRKTYLCKIISGEAKPGYEPEEEAHESYGIVEVKWFDLREVESWGDVRHDSITRATAKSASQEFKKIGSIPTSSSAFSFDTNLTIEVKTVGFK